MIGLIVEQDSPGLFEGWRSSKRNLYPGEPDTTRFFGDEDPLCDEESAKNLEGTS